MTLANDDKLASFSNRAGGAVQLVAPGVGLLGGNVEGGQIDVDVELAVTPGPEFDELQTPTARIFPSCFNSSAACSMSWLSTATTCVAVYP